MRSRPSQHGTARSVKGQHISGKRVTVMGLGRFGGGLGVTHWLHEGGADVLVTDLADGHDLREPLAQLPGGVRTRLGGHEPGDFANAHLVVASPAVPRPWDNPYLRAAHDAGVPVTTEIGIVASLLPDRARVVGVTGSAGKSTTSAMLARALRAVGATTALGGNIGGSLLGSLDTLPADAIVVLELSSFMLHWLGQDRWSPGVAVVTNLEANHLDWHGSFEHYAACKRAITRYQRPGDVLVSTLWPELTTPIRPTMRDAPVPLTIPGGHNRANAALALTAALATLERLGMEADADALFRAIASFPGLPHRLELAARGAGVRFYNDSKATTPAATARALAALRERHDPERLWLIMGGADKGVDPAALAEAARGAGGLCTIGATGPAIARRARGLCERVHEHGTLQAAVRDAADAIARAGGGAVLLSPGCASWDQFDNYERRGEAFTHAARRWIADRQEAATDAAGPGGNAGHGDPGNRLRGPSHGQQPDGA